MNALAPLHTLLSWTPAYRVKNTRPSSFQDFVADQKKLFGLFNPDNWLWQIKAIMTQDILKSFSGSAESAAASVRAKCLVINSPYDQMIYPETAAYFGKLINAERAELQGDCGHLAFLCEKNNLKFVLESFLNKHHQ